jgi:serine/threonine protein kinase
MNKSNLSNYEINKKLG